MSIAHQRLVASKVYRMHIYTPLHLPTELGTYQKSKPPFIHNMFMHISFSNEIALKDEMCFKLRI